MRALRVAHTVILALVFVATGTFTLFQDFGNVWLRSGLAICFYGWAARRIAFNRAIGTRIGLSPFDGLRSSLIGNVAGGCLCGIGCALIGGPIGWLGVAVCVVLVSLASWMLHQLASAAAQSGVL